MKPIDMSDYNAPAKAYWIAMVFVGASLCAWAIQRCLGFSPVQWGEFTVLLGLVILAGSHPIRIPNTRSSFTAGDAFTFLAVLFLGVPAAVLMGATDSFVSSRQTTKRLASWICAPAMMAGSVFVAGNAFYLTLFGYAHVPQNPLAGIPVRLDHLIGGLALMAIVQYLLNGFTVSTLYALRTRSPILKFWRDGYLWTWLSFLGAAVAAAVVYEAVSHLGFGYILLSVPVIVATFWTYKVYFERVNAKTREAEEMSRLHLATVEALATAIDAKDQTSHFHVRRSQIYAAGLGKLFGLSRGELAALDAGAYLHDVGKLAVPDHILNKPGKLTPAEFEKTKVHTIVGAEILSRIDFPYPVVPIIRHHHERWDGRGYPDGLIGDEIPITARIMSVVDCFDSVREARPFRPGMTREEAIELLQKGAHTHFDPKVINLFLDHLPQFEAEIVAQGLAEADDNSLAAYEQIRSAHSEVYALYEIAQKFGSSLVLENTLAVLADKVRHTVPYDTCAVYLFDETKGYATTALAVGANATALHSKCIAPGEGVTGFALANRRAVNRIHPTLDLAGMNLANEQDYTAMASLPLFKGDQLLGAISVYSMTLREYSDDQIRLLETVTRLASDAVANAMNHARAESNALTDQLTGLPNARGLQIRFEEEVARARRANKAFQVIMLDLDDFKLVNDTFGHKVGDRMLREVANLVHAQLREYDFLARYAGDEFVVIAPDLEVAQVEELRERIEKVVSSFSLNVSPQTHARVGISVGAAVYDVDGDSLDQLLAAADQAMYRAKSAHKTGPLGASKVKTTAPANNAERRAEISPKALITSAIN